MNRRGMFMAALAAPLGFLFGGKTKAESGLFQVEKLEKATAKLKPIRTPKLRIWKLGSIEHRVLPTQAAIQRLAGMLSEWDGESDLELIWDDALKMEQVDVATGDVDIVIPADAHIDVIQHGDGPKITIKKSNS